VPQGNKDGDAALGSAFQADRVGKGEGAPRKPGDDGDEEVVEA
jgi:hypothetical protein